MRARILRSVLSVILAVTVGGCASHARRGSATTALSLERVNAILMPELDSLRARYRNPYELIRAVRPGMLISRDFRPPVSRPDATRSEPIGVKVFVDDVYLGGIETLTTIPLRSIVFIQRMTPADATIRYGSGMTGGVIAITTLATRWR
jgi:hypothetical protein